MILWKTLQLTADVHKRVQLLCCNWLTWIIVMRGAYVQLCFTLRSGRKYGYSKTKHCLRPSTLVEICWYLRVLQKHYLMDSTLRVTLFDLLILQKDPLREYFNCWQRRTSVTTSEVLTKEKVLEFKVMYKNISYTDSHSKKFDMSPLIK